MVSFALGLVVAWILMRQVRSRWLDVASAWWTLSFTHRGEVLSIRTLSQILVFSLEIIPENDAVIVGAGLASLSGLVIANRSRLPAITS